MTKARGASPAPCGSRPTASGKFFYSGGRRLLVRGVTYGTFRPGPFGAPYPDAAVVRADFRRMRQVGVNAVRTYTPPPRWLLDEAMDAGLWVLVGIPWEQHVAFLDDPELVGRIEARIREGVLRTYLHPALLGYAVGNEIPAPIVRWSGREAIEDHIHRLYDVVKGVDPEALVTYANYPSTEYLDLPFLDFFAYNVYLESTPRLSAYLARLHTLAEDRPLLVSEIGMDSLRHGYTAQARLLSTHLEAIEAAGCAGSFTFAWTDEWHRGGREVEDWKFGLTTDDRCPKPALSAVRDVFATLGPEVHGEWPKISVVVCCYNAAKTLGECLDGLADLSYPEYEVIVVDDGSTDETASIAERAGVRLVRTPNRGLSRARNTGIREATGEIVAFIDSDAYPDPHWLTYLALTFESSDFVGVGGPNLAPRDEDLVAACVANAPGGAIHVLRTDREAEHVPGCNMAFRRSALLEVGGFDSRFRVAGDDVDLCWRLHARGWRIGFAAGAVVWHHPRGSIFGYWRQQCGYGVAEALLEAKWPDKYNVVGHVTWGGRVYGPAAIRFPLFKPRVYSGTWGQAPFQQREDPSPGVLWEAAAMPEWYLVLGVLVVLSLLGMSWGPLLLALPLLLIGAGVTVARALTGAVDARFDPFPSCTRHTFLCRSVNFVLHLLQPLARLKGRLVRGLVPWRTRTRTRRFTWPRPRSVEFWRDGSVALTRVLEQTERRLKEAGCVVRRDAGYDTWDLEVEGGGLGCVRLRSCEEWHEDGSQLLRFAIEPRLHPLTWIAVILGGALGVWAVADGAMLAGLILGSAGILAAIRSVWEAGTSTSALTRALHRAVPDGGAEESEDRERTVSEPPVPSRRIGDRSEAPVPG